MIKLMIIHARYFAQAYGRGAYGSQHYQDGASGGTSWLPVRLPDVGSPQGFLFMISSALIVAIIVGLVVAKRRRSSANGAE